ncbi:MAG TPA: sulfite exporter TauE/SafE family protein [Opitutaceae bacterium]|nr:sulfite exporter TauE/SafE family protein [Opitutaceae bacterium]
MSWHDYAGVFLLGLLGTGHCVGMCGGFALAVGAGAPGPGRVLARQVAYQFGKATSYLLIGVVLLLAGSMAASVLRLAAVQNAAGAAAGVLMIALGAAYLSEWRPPGWLAGWVEGSRVCGALAAIWRSPSLYRSTLIGWVNGFLPCGLSFAVLLHLASFGSVGAVAGGAYVFGLATLPGLLAVSLVGRGWSVSRRRGLVRASGVVLILFGALTIVRGVPAVHRWFHQHLLIERRADMPMEMDHGAHH